MDELVIQLQHPIVAGKNKDGTERVIDELHFRRGHLGDLKGIVLAETMPASDAMLIASRLSGQPLGVIERLDAEDAGGVLEYVLGFYGRCLTTGKPA